MSTVVENISEIKQDLALQLVASWVGRQINSNGAPADTGEDAYVHGRGPMLRREWDWPNEPRPTILMEGALDEWAYFAAADTELTRILQAIGVYAEPFSSYALCLYPMHEPFTGPTR